VSALLQRADHRPEREDALAEERTVEGTHGEALVVRDLNRVNASRRIAPDRLEQPALPARMPEVQHVATAAPGAHRDLARGVERADEGEVLAERVDHLDGEPDAGRGRFGEQP